MFLAMRMRWLGGIVLALGVTGCKPHAVVSQPTDPNGPLLLTAATFNVRYENGERESWQRWPNRLHNVTVTLRRMNPDVFGVQEALHGQVADLRASLPDFEFFGVGRDDAKTSGEYSAIFWKRDRFSRDEYEGGTFWLSDTPETPGSRTWGNEIPRIVSWVRLLDRHTGRGLYVFNTHWDHKNQNSREKAAQLLLTRIQQRVHKDEPVVLTGDFNAIESNNAVASLTKSPTLALTNTYQHPEIKDRRTLHFWSGDRKGVAKIDHIFTTLPVDVEASSIVYPKAGETLPSDHYPVFATFTFPPIHKGT